MRHILTVFARQLPLSCDALHGELAPSVTTPSLSFSVLRLTVSLRGPCPPTEPTLCKAKAESTRAMNAATQEVHSCTTSHDSGVRLKSGGGHRTRPAGQAAPQRLRAASRDAGAPRQPARQRDVPSNDVRRIKASSLGKSGVGPQNDSFEPPRPGVLRCRKAPWDADPIGPAGERHGTLVC